MNRRELYVTPQDYEVGHSYGNVGLRVRTAELDSLLPALDLILRLEPGEARTLASKLLERADAAEAGRPPTH